MADAVQAWAVLDASEVLYPAAAIEDALARMGREITLAMAGEYPLVLAVMGGAVFLAGQLLPRLRFPLDFDYMHVTRYRGRTTGGEIDWQVAPRAQPKGRSVLVLDDILDEGQTMAAIRTRMLDAGAARFRCAVLCDKALARAKPLAADFTGVSVPDRYVFGCGMDVQGLWRNLPAIHALRGGETRTED